MKTFTKKTFAAFVGISSSTLRRRMNQLWYNELIKKGYRKTDRIITQRILKTLCQKMGIDL
jgi:hypothetical protein